MFVIKRIAKSDLLGITASLLCLLHCVATPLIFIAKACSVSCCADNNAPTWWKLLDYLFLIISFLSIYYATKNSSKKWIRTALWTSWGLLSFTLFNEVVGLIGLPETFIYIPALLIVFLHAYNYKYCKCSNDKCCAV